MRAGNDVWCLGNKQGEYMMSKIIHKYRRTLSVSMVLAAALAVSACEKGPEGVAGGGGGANAAVVPYGDNPASAGPEKTFAPNFFTVIYTKFGDGGSPLTARQAYFNVSDGQDDVQCAIEYLRSDGRAEKDCGLFTPTPESGLPAIRRDFDDFLFGSRQRVYVFVDNENIAFNAKNPLTFQPFGAFDNPFDAKSPTRDANRTFYSAAVGPLGNSKSEGLYLENFFRNADGEPFKDGDKATNYYLTFNLLFCRGGKPSCDFTDPKQVIPVLIDPDTGNGQGQEPYDP